MEVNKRTIAKLCKAVLLGILIVLSILIWSLYPELQAEKQGFSIDSAVIISIGLGGALSMMLHSGNNQNF